MNIIDEDEDEKELLDEEVELDDDILDVLEVPEVEEEELDAVPDLFLKEALIEEEEEEVDDESLEFDLFDDIDE